jgi:hypothetical protein
MDTCTFLSAAPTAFILQEDGSMKKERGDKFARGGLLKEDAVIKDEGGNVIDEEARVKAINAHNSRVALEAENLKQQKQKETEEARARKKARQAEVKAAYEQEIANELTKKQRERAFAAALKAEREREKKLQAAETEYAKYQTKKFEEEKKAHNAWKEAVKNGGKLPRNRFAPPNAAKERAEQKRKLRKTLADEMFHMQMYADAYAASTANSDFLDGEKAAKKCIEEGGEDASIAYMTARRALEDKMDGDGVDENTKNERIASFERGYRITMSAGGSDPREELKAIEEKLAQAQQEEAVAVAEYDAAADAASKAAEEFATSIEDAAKAKEALDLLNASSFELKDVAVAEAMKLVNANAVAAEAKAKAKHKTEDQLQEEKAEKAKKARERSLKLAMEKRALQLRTIHARKEARAILDNGDTPTADVMEELYEKMKIGGYEVDTEEQRLASIQQLKNDRVMDLFEEMTKDQQEAARKAAVIAVNGRRELGEPQLIGALEMAGYHASTEAERKVSIKKVQDWNSRYLKKTLTDEQLAQRKKEREAAVKARKEAKAAKSAEWKASHPAKSKLTEEEKQRIFDEKLKAAEDREAKKVEALELYDSLAEKYMRKGVFMVGRATEVEKDKLKVALKAAGYNHAKLADAARALRVDREQKLQKQKQLAMEEEQLAMREELARLRAMQGANKSAGAHSTLTEEEIADLKRTAAAAERAKRKAEKEAAEAKDKLRNLVFAEGSSRAGARSRRKSNGAAADMMDIGAAFETLADQGGHSVDEMRQLFETFTLKKAGQL